MDQMVPVYGLMDNAIIIRNVQTSNSLHMISVKQHHLIVQLMELNV